MAIIEIQFRENIFFDVLRAQIVRMDIPRSFFPELGPDRLIERIEPGQVGFADPNDPPVGGQRDGEVLFKVSFQLHHTSFAAARAAGSLKSPATRHIDCIFWIKISGSAPSALVWTIAGAIVSGQFRPVPPIGGVLPLGGLDVPVLDLQAMAGDGVVAFRLGTKAGDELLGPVENRLAGADWGQFIQGQVFADQLAETINTAVQDATAGSSDPVLEIDYLASGIWTNLIGGILSPPDAWGALAGVEIVAVDAIPVINTDVPVRITASTQITADVLLHKLVLRTTINWHAHDFITTGSGGLITVVEDEVSKGILSKLKAPPGQQEVERGDNYIVYRSSLDIFQPKTPLFITNVQQASIDGNGLRATGKLTVFPAPSATFSLDAQRWASGIDCSTKSWKTEFHPPVVHIFCPDRFFVLQIRSYPIVDPAGFWIPTFGTTGVGTGIETRDIEFKPPFPMKPDGAISSAYIDTNLGVRWVDLGAVPAKPAPVSNDPFKLESQAISQCMAISDLWGMGVMNLDWLSDPPDYELGLDPLREWTIVADDIIDLERIELAAISPNGTRRLASPPVEGGTMYAQIVTDAHETLQIRSSVRLLSAPPQVLQRWIVPWTAIPVEPGITPLALSDGVLWVADGSKLARIELPGNLQMTTARGQALKIRHVNHNDAPLRAVTRLKSGLDHGMTLSRTVGQGRIVAVLHKGHIVLGVAGNRIRTTEAAKSGY